MGGGEGWVMLWPEMLPGQKLQVLYTLHSKLYTQYSMTLGKEFT